MRKDIQLKIPLREGVSASVSDKSVTVKGKSGEISREFKFPNVKITVANNTIQLDAPQATQRDKKAIYTTQSHVKNMVTGAADGFIYKLKICSGHFPMTVTVDKNTLVVKNFIGEVVPRRVAIKAGVKVAVEGEIVTVSGTDLELVSQCAGDIEKLCKRPNFDNRIFQDGIYIIEKAGQPIQ